MGKPHGLCKDCGDEKDLHYKGRCQAVVGVGLNGELRQCSCKKYRG